MPGAIDITKYLDGLAQVAGLDDAAKSELKALTDKYPKLADSMTDSGMLRSDYSRNMDTLKKDREALETKEKDWRTWYGDVTKEYDALKTENAELKAKNGNGSGNNGNGSGDGNNLPPSLTKKDIDDAAANSRKFTVDVTKSVARITAKHLHEFNEEPDFDAIEKIAIDKNIPVLTAYDEWVAPKRKERADKATEDHIKREVETRVSAELSKHNLPTETGSRPYHAFFDRDKNAQNVPKGDQARSESFTKAYQDAGNKR
jgi:hypothetical protein